MREVYGDCIHVNDDSCFSGGIKDNGKLNLRWHDLMVVPSHKYYAPGGKLVRRYVRVISDDIRGFQYHHWKAK